jgi:hypothetical protein
MHSSSWGSISLDKYRDNFILYEAYLTIFIDVIVSVTRRVKGARKLQAAETKLQWRRILTDTNWCLPYILIIQLLVTYECFKAGKATEWQR